MAEAFIQFHACRWVHALRQQPYLYSYLLYIYPSYKYVSLPVFTDLFVFFSYYSFIVDYVVYSYSFTVTDFVVYFSKFLFIVSYADIEYLYIYFEYLYTYFFISECRVLRRQPSDEVAVR